MGSKVEKVLILTLGTGLNLSREEGKEIQQLSEKEKKNKMLDIFSSNKFNYINATYRLPETAGEQQDIQSEFVAKPLVHLEQPKKIFIIGTVKSSWSSFYNKFAANRNFESYYTLFKIEDGNGKDTEDKRLKEIAKIIEEIYKEDDVLRALYLPNKPPTDVELHILLTKYGLNDEELEYNYEIISSFEKYLKEDRKYQVSFDITHSFRSTPIYSLVILNYLKHITKYQIEISHVYYGNLEVSRETGKAYIIDLKDLVGVLELTNGVGEFRDTGNAVALLRELLDSEKELKTALERFDWATQINDYQAIIDSAKDLWQKVKTSGTKNRYTGLRDMLSRVLEEHFISEERLNELTEDDAYYPDHIAEIQLCICKWHQSQNRYGLAVATASEALRSYLVTFYLRQKQDKELYDAIELEDCRDEDNRKNAIDKLTHLANYNSVDYVQDYLQDGKIKDVSVELTRLCDIEELRERAKKIRDRFAHNLSPDQEEMDEAKEMNLDDKKTINDFIEALDVLLKGNKTKIAEAYRWQPKKKKKISKKDIRLIICNADRYGDNYKGLLDYEPLSKSKKKKYNVYFLNKCVADKISGKQNKEKVVCDAFLLRQFIEENFEQDHLNVILDGFEFSQYLFYTAILSEKGENSISVSMCQYGDCQDDNQDADMEVPSSLYIYDMPSYEIAKKTYKVGLISNATRMAVDNYKIITDELAEKGEKAFLELSDVFKMSENE